MTACWPCSPPIFTTAACWLGDTVVVTVMTNLGFHLAMAAAGIAVHQTPVGDRYVLEALDGHGWSLGGEQSGHLIFRDLATTGDGVLSGLLLIDLLVRPGRPLAELAAEAMVRLPQVLRNVSVGDHANLDQAQGCGPRLRAVERELGGGGRVLLRPSGTERMVRVMVEAPDPDRGGRSGRPAGGHGPGRARGSGRLLELRHEPDTPRSGSIPMPAPFASGLRAA